MESVQQEVEASSQEEQPPHPHDHEECRRRRRGKKARRIRLVLSRGYTILVLVISIILLSLPHNNMTGKHIHENMAMTDHYSPAPSPNQPPFQIDQHDTKRSIESALIIGAGCNLFQLGMLIYCIVTGKDMERNKYKVFFDYYCDKVVSLLLAATTGAGIGSMLDKIIRPNGQMDKNNGNFFLLPEGISTTTLLATVIVSMSVSATCSAEVLRDYNKTVVKGEKTVGMLGSWTNKAYNCCCTCMEHC